MFPSKVFTVPLTIYSEGITISLPSPPRKISVLYKITKMDFLWYFLQENHSSDQLS